jgi:ABC transport system ATP-binding/permease protein
MSKVTYQPTVVGGHPFLVLQRGQEVLKFSLGDEFYRLGRDPNWSDFDIPGQGWEALSRQHAVLKREGENYRIFDGDGDRQLSSNGLLFNRTRIRAEGLLLSGSVQLEIGQDPLSQILVRYVNPNTAQQSVNVHQRRRLDLKSCKAFPIALGRVEVEQYESMQLDAPTVSCLHAEIYQDSPGVYSLVDHRSSNGTFVNHCRLSKPKQLQQGDVIRIGPFTLLFHDEILELFDQGRQIRLDVHDLSRQVKEGKGEKIILNGVSLAIEPGQFVALVGGSGAGKSTLMKTLLGIEPITNGCVYINGDDIRKSFDLYRTEIGYVPQQDIMHRELTVEEVLFYACKLRLPPDVSVSQVVNKTLEQVKLSHVKDTLVSRLSGGQLKRVSIAVELLADPWLFFLDEPTSGLDPGLDKEMMQLLRELAKQGRTVVLVTHATTNIEVCDRIAFMGRGGRLCYFGSPQEAMQFFEQPDDLKYFSDIYIELERGQTKEEVNLNVHKWSQKFTAPDSLLHQKYVRNCLSAGNASTRTQRAASTGLERASAQLRQLLLLSQRNFKIVVRDWLSLSLSLFTAPIGILLITLTLGDKNPLAKVTPLEVTQAPLALRVLFVFTCASLWVGLSSSVQEIVKEANVYARERLVNLGLLPYLGSKVLNRSALAGIQAVLISVFIYLGFQRPEPQLIPWFVGVLMTVFMTLFASFSFGLMISALAKNESQASSTLPLILLPQIIFSGVLFKLEGWVRVFSWLTISRWSVGALGSLVDVNAMVPEMPISPIGVALPMPFEPTQIYDPTWRNLSINWLILGLHAIVYLSVSLWKLKRKDQV